MVGTKRRRNGGYGVAQLLYCTNSRGMEFDLGLRVNLIIWPEILFWDCEEVLN